ncbi:MAG: TetR family transcriptional regulator C-terminal domain-containing protein [Hyphomicrobiaceae bacterium]|nr:TetR family transcriptional regulator C-terminal domain-containing protein [Hyphomicrobiaceae bacterium]
MNQEGQTRIQREKRELILEAALDVFSVQGFRGATVDQIALAAGMSKPNLLYYFPNKEAIHHQLMERLLDTWLQPLEHMNPLGDPIAEITAYVQRKLEMARDYPRESRIFANEILRGAKQIMDLIEGELKELVDKQAGVMRGWIERGQMADVDPYHLIFSIWATTQHYSDFDAQVRAVLGPERNGNERFEGASRYLDRLYRKMLAPDAG